MNRVSISNLSTVIAGVTLGLIVNFAFETVSCANAAVPDKKLVETKSKSKFAKQIADLVSQQENAWNKGNLQEFLQSYAKTKDVTYVSSGSVFKGYEAIRNRYIEIYGQNRASMGSLNLSELEISDLGAAHVLCIGKFTVVHHAHVPIYGRFSLIFAKTKDGWKIIYDHSSH